MGVAGAVFALTGFVPLLVLAALTGISTDPNEAGPITTVEQSMLSLTPPAERSRVYGRYNAVAYLAGAAGALAAGGPSAVRDIVPGLPPDQRWLLLMPVGAVVCVLLAVRLTGHVEVEGDQPHALARPAAIEERGPAPGRPLRARCLRRGLHRPEALVFWFGRQFSADAQVMGLVFFGVGLLQAASSVVAGWLAARFGMLNTMVFSHLPSNVLLALIPFAPSLEVAVLLLFARPALSQMDVPARQAYVAALVDPAERTAAAGYTNAARHLARPAGPAWRPRRWAWRRAYPS